MTQSLNPTFATLSPAGAAPATFYETWSKMDPIAAEFIDGEVCDWRVAKILGSDAKFTPVGRLEYPEGCLWQVLSSLGVHLDDAEKPLLSLMTTDKVKAVVHTVPKWPGYYMVVRSYWNVALKTRPVDVYVFRLVK